MPDFTVPVDPEDLTRQDLVTAVSLPGLGGGTPDGRPAATGSAAHHGARDARLAARQRSERDRAGRATGGAGRSYAFRRS